MTEGFRYVMYDDKFLEEILKGSHYRGPRIGLYIGG